MAQLPYVIENGGDQTSDLLAKLSSMSLGTLWWSQAEFHVPYFGELIPFDEYVDQVGWKHHLDEYPVVNCIVTVDGPDSRVLEPNHF